MEINYYLTLYFGKLAVKNLNVVNVKCFQVSFKPEANLR